MSEEVKKQKARERAKRYYEKNKEKILKRQKEYVKKRYMEDEEFRKKVKEKNKNYVINNPEKVREIKRKSQHKYITKKRLNGELPLTQKMLNEQLQQENQQLKEKLKDEERWRVKIAKENSSNVSECLKLIEQKKQYESVLDEIRDVLNNQMDYREFVDVVNAIEEILDKVKE